MSSHEDHLIENVRDALRAYERYLLSSVLSSFFLVVYAAEEPHAKVPIGYGQIGVGWAFFIALALYFFFSFAARYALVRAADNASRIRTPERREALALLPSIATDHQSAFRVVMLLLAPTLILGSMAIEFAQSDIPPLQWPWLGLIFFCLFVGLMAYAVWERLHMFERATSGTTRTAEPA